VSKAFEFADSFFSKPAILAIQKWWMLCCQLFNRELFIVTYLTGWKTGEIGRGWFSKALSAAPINL
jgi:hypothetical protein